jgi:autotransporter-associated beta strand protein
MSSRSDCLRLLAVLLTLPILGVVAGDVSAAAVTWAGDGITNAWDTTTPNWTGASSYYADGDDVTFNDSGYNSPDISLSSAMGFGLMPGSVTVSNSAGHDYVFAGTASLAGFTGITKSGDGMLSINTTLNTFDGVVTVNGGTLRMGSISALGSTAGGTFVNSGGTLDLYYDQTAPPALSETITVADGGKVVNNRVSTNYPEIDNLVLAGNATFGGSDRIEIRGTPSFGSYTLTVDHTGNGDSSAGYDAVRITNLRTHDLLNANVVQGSLAFHNSGLGVATGTITVTDNPTATYVTSLQLMETVTPTTNIDLTKNLSFTGGRIYCYRGYLTLHGGFVLNDSATEIYVFKDSKYSNTLTLADPVTGDGGITKTGGGTLTLQAVNTYSGDTTINGSKLILGASASIGNSPVIDVLNTASTFDVSAVTGGFTLAGTQTLMGRGAVAGNVTAASGSTIEAGSAGAGTIAGVGSLDLKNNLDMSAGASLVWELGTLKDSTTGVAGTDFDQLSVAGSLVLGGSSKLTLDFDLLAEALQPSAATPDAFWTTDHTWTVVDVGTAGSTTSDFSMVVNGTFAAGTFDTLVESNDVLLKFTATTLLPIPGDTDGNRIVNDLDAKKVAQNWGATGLPGGFSVGDFNGDGAVNAADASILAANWGDHTGGESVAGVPEPSTIVLLLGAAVLLLTRRR